MKRQSFLAVTLLLLGVILISYGGLRAKSKVQTSGLPTTDIMLSTTTPDVVSKITIENTVPVGISTFAIALPGFPAQDVLKALEPLRTVATNQLWDFPDPRKDLDQVLNTLAELVGKGHIVYHEIHVFNGPGTRKGDEESYNAFLGKRSNSAAVRKAYLNNQLFRDKVQAKFAEVISFANKVEDLGIFVVICPELEDNQSDATYTIMLDLLKRAGWIDELGNLRYNQVARNGSGKSRFGILRESHSTVGVLKPGDIFNQDGKDVSFAKKVSSSYYSAKKTLTLMKQARLKSVIFYIWLAELQGFKKYTSSGSKYNGSRHLRTYLFEDQAAVAQLLVESTQ